MSRELGAPSSPAGFQQPAAADSTGPCSWLSGTDKAPAIAGKRVSPASGLQEEARRAQEAENSEINPEKSILSILMDAGLAIKQMLLLKSAFHFNVGFLKLSPSFLANEQQEPPERLHTMIKLKQHLS